MKLNRVHIFFPSFAGGGAERMMVYLANEMVESECSVTVIVNRSAGPYIDMLDKRVVLLELGAKKTIYSVFKFIKLKKLEVRAYGVFNCISTLNSPNLINVLVKMLSPKNHRCIIRIANTLSVERNSLSLMEKVFDFLSTAIYQKADSVVCVSQGVADDCRVYYNVRNPVIIYNPVVNRELKDRLHFLRIKKESLGNSCTVLAMGRVLPQKGFDVLIKAFAEVVAQRPNLELKILGSYNYNQAYKDELMALASSLNVDEKVHFVGYQVDPFLLLSKGRIFVLSSYFEGLPSGLIQAMAVGLPVVSTDCPSGPSEILANGKYGRLVPTGDHKILTKAILDELDSSLSDPDSRSARAFEFGAEEAAKKYLELCR